MAFPISQTNKEAVLKRVAAVCWDALKYAENNNKNNNKEKETLLLVKNPPLVKAVRELPVLACAVVRNLEQQALLKTVAFCKGDLQALDLKEYYQE